MQELKVKIFSQLKAFFDDLAPLPPRPSLLLCMFQCDISVKSTQSQLNYMR